MVYTSITFIVTWLLWLMVFIPSTSRIFLLISSDRIIRIGTLIPSIAGLICAYLFGGISDIKGLIKSLSNIKIDLKWVLYTLFLFPSIAFLSYIAFRLTGGDLPTSHFPVWFIPVAFLYILVLMGPLGEELGWRGFALKRMLLICSPLKAGLITGILWSMWHIPLFFIQGTIQNELAENGLIIAILCYFLYTTCISLLMTILYINTNCSLLACILFHTICNLTLGIVPLILTKSGAIILLLFIFLITTAIIYKYIPSWRKLN